MHNVYASLPVATTVEGSSVSIWSGAAGSIVEITARTAGVHVHVLGGTASAAAGATGCVYVPQNGSLRLRVAGTTLTAIRDGATSALVTTAVLSS